MMAAVFSGLHWHLKSVAAQPTEADAFERHSVWVNDQQCLKRRNPRSRFHTAHPGILAAIGRQSFWACVAIKKLKATRIEMDFMIEIRTGGILS